MHLLKPKLARVLAADAGERKACQFIKANPEVLLWAFCTRGGHSLYVLPEFPFGSNYRADFVIPFSYSGAWEVHLVELEPPSDLIFTKSGRPTKRLNGAISQIGDWKTFIQQNHVLIRKDLSDWCMKKDVLGLSSMSPPSNHTGDFLNDPQSYVEFHYHIVIGRRGRVTQEIRRKMNQYRYDARIEICTYDRLLDIAANLDDAKKNPRKTVDLARTSEHE
jgi:hypothetical protein